MTARYSVAMAADQTPPPPGLPDLWLLSDARNDAALEPSLAALPPGSALVFRHYHLDEKQRRTRFDTLAALARKLGHSIVLSDEAARAHAWGADGIYGPPARVASAQGLALLVATAHNQAEIAAAVHAGAHAVMLSPVFATRSHPGGSALGPARFRSLARTSTIPVIALGGMDTKRARELNCRRWAAIEGLTIATDRPGNA